MKNVFDRGMSSSRAGAQRSKMTRSYFPSRAGSRYSFESFNCAGVMVATSATSPG